IELRHQRVMSVAQRMKPLNALLEDIAGALEITELGGNATEQEAGIGFPPFVPQFPVDGERLFPASYRSFGVPRDEQKRRLAAQCLCAGCGAAGVAVEMTLQSAAAFRLMAS